MRHLVTGGSGFLGRALVSRLRAAGHEVATPSSKDYDLTVLSEAQGKSMAAFDSIIAATARAYDCKLVTRNVRDFAHADIDVHDPWQDQ